MTRNAKIRLKLMMAATLLPLMACDDSGVSGANGKTSLSVYLTDAAGDVDSVWVEILSINLQGGDGPVELLGEPTDLILLTDLVGVTQLLVDDAELDPGMYSQLRMRVGDAVLLSSDPSDPFVQTVYVKGEGVDLAPLREGLGLLPTGDLQCPSCSQSGIKVKIPNDQMEMEEGETVLVLDFDVDQSFGHRAGNSGKWVMHPVIHGTLTDQPSSALSISGTVVLAEESGVPITIPACPEEGDTRTIQDFTPTATFLGIVDGEGNPIVRTGQVGEDGTFEINFLPPGSYAMGYHGLDLEGYVLTFTATVEPAQVTLEDVSAEGVVYTIQSAACVAGS